MKRIIASAILLLAALTGMAQSSSKEVFKPTFITGTLAIRFNTATQTDGDGKPRAGVTDIYALDLNVSDSVKFHGTIKRQPYLNGGAFGSDQPGLLTFDVDTDIVNPNNVSQTKNVGKLFGVVPVDKQNVYRFTDSNLKVSVFSVGRAEGFESRFNGLALGKPPADSSVASKLRSALSFSKTTGGKTTTIAVTKYDRMEFQQLILAGGPVKSYPVVTADGAAIYDYGRTAWYFQNVTVSYSLDGRVFKDVISGNIRWDEQKHQYDFDIRVNEPAPSEVAAFSKASESSEADFFATDSTIPGLSGTMKYTDTKSGDTTTSSVVQIDLKGNQLHRSQAMALAKLIIFTMIVPLNSD